VENSLKVDLYFAHVRIVISD